MMTRTFTSAQAFALHFAAAEGRGTVCAGHNYTRRGSRHMVAASTLRALERLGMVELFLSPDGGMSARLTERGRAAAGAAGGAS